jgi:CheY-like chemotaxis protein
MVEKELLKNINITLKTLGSDTLCTVLPDLSPDDAHLKGKTILMVDDKLINLQLFVPALMVATDGKALFLHVQDEEELDEVVEKILALHPDIVLLDYNISENIKGDYLVEPLQEQSEGIIIVGFSSDRSGLQAFENAGVTHCVEKRSWDPVSSIKELAEIFL